MWIVVYASGRSRMFQRSLTFYTRYPHTSRVVHRGSGGKRARLENGLRFEVTRVDGAQERLHGEILSST